MLEVTLPWPSSKLNPNVVVHWAVRAKATKEARHYAYYYTLSKGHGQILQDCNFQLEQHVKFYPPDRRKRDEDNCLRMIKASRDGIFQALGADDSIIRKTVIEWGAVVKGGQVVLKLTELEYHGEGVA